MSRNNKFLLVYGTANAFTLFMLFMLQVSSWPIFILWLVLMHLGIIALALTKRKFKDLDIKTYYKRVYLSFALFIPILIYKLILAIIDQEENESVVNIAVIIVMTVSVIVLLFNIISFILKNKKANR